MVIILSREGCTQGDVDATMIYRITTLPQIKQVCADVPGAFVPAYADDLASCGAEQRNTAVMQALLLYGPYYGYFPEPEKSWYICQEDEEASRVFVEAGLPIQLTRG